MPKQGSVELFVGREWKDKQGRGLGDELGRGEGEIGDGGVLPWVAGEVALRGRRVASASSQQGWRPPARGKEGGVESGRDAWMPRRPGGGLGAAQRDGRAALSVGGEKQRNREGSLRWKKSGPICNFQKLQGPDCKAKLTFKLGLK